MTHDNQHLTTEQLSAFTDGALSAEESSWANAHMQTCTQCQQQLAELRFTASLLRSMPKPLLPRSFVLPIESESFSTIESDAGLARESLPLAAYRATSIEPFEPVGAQLDSQHMTPLPMRSHRRVWPTAVRRMVGSLSTLAAVIGLFFMLSGLFAPLFVGGTSTSAPSSSMIGQAGNSASPCQGQQPCDTAISTEQASPEVNATTTSGTDSTPAATPSAEGTPTPVPGQGQAANATPSTKDAPTPVPTSDVGNVFSSSGDPQGSSESDNSRSGSQQGYAPPSFFLDLVDLSTTLGRVTLGLLLVMLSTVGFLLVRIQQKRSASS